MIGRLLTINLCFNLYINDALPETQKALGLKVNHSNVCTEITLPTNEDRTAVCCLSSVNLETYLVRFLDNVLTSLPL